MTMLYLRVYKQISSAVITVPVAIDDSQL